VWSGGVDGISVCLWIWEIGIHSGLADEDFKTTSVTEKARELVLTTAKYPKRIICAKSQAIARLTNAQFLLWL
jgi:hypothetical protein